MLNCYTITRVCLLSHLLNVTEKKIAGSYSAPWQKATSLKQIYNNVNSDKCDLVTPQMKRDVHTKSN